MSSLFSRVRRKSILGKVSRITSEDLRTTTGPDDDIALTKRSGDEKTRTRGGKLRRRLTVTSPKGACGQVRVPSTVAQVPDGGFLPLNLDHRRKGTDDDAQHRYGYLSFERHVVLGINELAMLVEVVVDELASRFLTTPFIFSALALDISSSTINQLISAFLDTCADPSSREAEHRWRQEARFAGAHELGMCLRWGLARVVRVAGGQAMRGLISWEHYTDFRDSEAALGYPPAHFSTFLPQSPHALRSILLTLLDLLTRFVAHSSSSGLTPPTLSSFFGPLLFGLGPPGLPFYHTYVQYLYAVTAMEHILLAYIRWQDAPRTPLLLPGIGTRAPRNGTTPTTPLGTPARLKEWIRGYPAMLSVLYAKDTQGWLQVRRGVRTIRIVHVRRNVAMYSPDLVYTAASWASSSGGRAGRRSGFAASKEWQRIDPSALKLQPSYSEGYMKRMNLPRDFRPYTGQPSDMSAAATSWNPAVDEDDPLRLASGLGYYPGTQHFKTLTEKKWVEFEKAGFGSSEGNAERLRLNLSERARMIPLEKRRTMNWNDFAAIGFSRSGDLDVSLHLNNPVIHKGSPSLTRGPSVARKLRKAPHVQPQVELVSEPVLGSEEVIEEAFLGVFCDLIYGGGWSDMEHVEKVDKESNWALVSLTASQLVLDNSEACRHEVEFKALPANETSVRPGVDPRTATTVVLFEEFIPAEYKENLMKDTATRSQSPFRSSLSIKSRR
ncbi:hypothetical protein EDD16DRAFT_1710186 [Pisolithus croceorrhizus]|nr:hypothetical protein EDD16DRAFT_1710186 [Pisolithus croceorrhizus]KAI6122554.1 hypothetical protein EV401DRAFT_2069949 [Pisolithus croceorrhizus]